MIFFVRPTKNLWKILNGKIGRWIFALATAIIVSQVPSAIADVHHVEGKIKYQRRGQDNVDAWVDASFSASVENCRWIIRFSSPRFHNDYFEVGCDGTNTYYLSSFVTWYNSQKAAGVELGNNVGTAVVRKSPVPAFGFAHYAGPIWLTFCSGCSFQSLGTNRIAEPPAVVGAIENQDRNPDSYIFQSVSFTSSSNSLQVPNEISYLADPTNGINRSEFKILATTNTPGLVYPLRSYFQTFYRDTNRSNQESVVEYEVIAASVRTTLGSTTGEDYKPKIAGLVNFTEERFGRPDQRLVGNRLNHFTYKATNWLSDAEVMELPVYKLESEFARANRGPRKMSLLGVVAICAVLFFPFLCSRRLFSNKRQSKE